MVGKGANIMRDGGRVKKNDAMFPSNGNKVMERKTLKA